MPAVDHDHGSEARAEPRREVRVPRDPDPYERIYIDGEAWIWEPEAGRWLLESVLPKPKGSAAGLRR